VIASLLIGAGSGVILYGLFVAFTSARSTLIGYLTRGSIKMTKFLWALVIVAAVVVQATQTNIMFALGATAPWFIAGLVFSPIWWGVTKRNRRAPWQWFDWLNAGAYIMLVLFVLRIAINAYMRSKGVA
jgi:hypothetical protein